MTKKSISLIVFTVICLNLFAQETKPFLFIGRYNTNKTNCSNQGWVHKEVKDRQEYELERLQYREEHKADVGMTYPTDCVSEKECVIVYEVTRINGAFNCTQTFINYIKGFSIENCKEQLAARVAESPKDYPTQPKIIFSRESKAPVIKYCTCEMKEKLNRRYLGQYFDYVFLCKKSTRVNRVITISHTGNVEAAKKLAEQQCAEEDGN